jgi:acylphosphatase
MKKSRRLYLTGMVQGIMFRPYIKENADKLNVRGFVRNLEDKRVEVFIEGNPDEVEKMIEICKRGTKLANIKNVEIKEEKFQGFKEFKILNI